MDRTETIVITVFDVAAERQAELVDLLREGAEAVVRHRPGFVAATLLAGIDGSRVVNLARWAGPDDVQAAFADPAVQGYARRAGELAAAAPSVYAVAAEIGA
jgi:hypothetical protein